MHRRSFLIGAAALMVSLVSPIRSLRPASGGVVYGHAQPQLVGEQVHGQVFVHNGSKWILTHVSYNLGQGFV